MDIIIIIIIIISSALKTRGLKTKFKRTIPLVARGPSLVESCHPKMTAMYRCTVTDSLWNRYADCRSSWNFEEILRPSSRRKSTADSLSGPSVSTVMG